jgi:DNA-binding MarR family transcriptional regulator
MPARTEAAVEVEQEAYNAIIATYKVIKHYTLGLFSEEGLTEAQLQALGLLVRDGSMLMRKLSDSMLVTPANITGIVDRLEEKKLIRRTSSKGDRRATIIEITLEGKALYDRVAKKKATLVQKALATFTREEQRTLRNLLERFQREMSSAIEENAAPKIQD